MLNDSETSSTTGMANMQMEEDPSLSLRMTKNLQ